MFWTSRCRTISLLAQFHHADAVDVLEDLDGLDHAAFLIGGQVHLGDVARDNHLRAVPEAGQHHQHLQARGVLGLVADDDGLVQGPAPHEGQGDDLDDIQLHELAHLGEVHHVFDRVEERPQVGIDLRGDIARQKAQFLAGLDGRAGQHDPPNLAFLEHGNRHRDGQIRLSRSRRTRAERQVVLEHRLDVLQLPLGRGLDHFVGVDRDRLLALLPVRHRALLDELGHIVHRQLPVFEQMLLHLVDHLGRPMDARIRTADVQVRLACRDLHAQGPAQKTKVACRPGRTTQVVSPGLIVQLLPNVSPDIDPFFAGLPYAANLKNTYATGAANSSESTTSNIPPKPGTRFDESFCCASRLSIDSARSLSCPITAMHAPKTGANQSFIISKTTANAILTTAAATTAPRQPLPGLPRTDARRQLVLAEQLAKRVSSDIRTLYDKNEHQDRPGTAVNANPEHKGPQQTQIQHRKTTDAAVGQCAVVAKLDMLLQQQAASTSATTRRRYRPWETGIS